MVCVLHVLKKFSNLVSTIGAFYIVCKNISVSPNLSNERVSGSLEHQADAEVWIVLFLL